MQVQRIDETPINFDNYYPDAVDDILNTQHNNSQFMIKPMR